jgi:2-C-methyl-D-erythritol 4-phosphate cytidylyltransferase
MRYWAVIPAAGLGQRFAGELPKQYAPLLDRTVLEWSIASFAEDVRCAGIAVAVAANDQNWLSISQRLPQVIAVVGGVHRCESVLGALVALTRKADSEDWILVHDAARPCLSVAERDRLLLTLAQHPVGGLLAIPVADTLKQVDDRHTVSCTAERNHFWQAQTPQMFRYGALRAALEHAVKAGRLPSDEAQAMEWSGQLPQVVQGAMSNIKITFPADLALAAALLKTRQEVR